MAVRNQRAIRFVLSDVAVRRLRAAEATMSGLRTFLYDNAPARIVNDVSEALLAIHEAVIEIDKCNVEEAGDAPA